MTTDKPITLTELLHKAEYELACPRCQNNPRGVFKAYEWDECPECRGGHRNSATIELLRALTKGKADDCEGGEA